MQVLQLAPQIGLLFAITAVGYAGGTFVAGRYSVRLGLNRMILLGSLFTVAGLGLLLLLTLAGIHSALVFFGCTIFVGAGNGMTLPNANAGMLSIRPELAGTASGLGGAIQIGGGAAIAALAGALLGPGSDEMPLVLLMLACATASLSPSASAAVSTNPATATVSPSGSACATGSAEAGAGTGSASPSLQLGATATGSPSAPATATAPVVNATTVTGKSGVALSSLSRSRTGKTSRTPRRSMIRRTAGDSAIRLTARGALSGQQEPPPPRRTK